MDRRSALGAFLAAIPGVASVQAVAGEPLPISLTEQAGTIPMPPPGRIIYPQNEPLPTFILSFDWHIDFSPEDVRLLKEQWENCYSKYGNVIVAGPGIQIKPANPGLCGIKEKYEDFEVSVSGRTPEEVMRLYEFVHGKRCQASGLSPEEQHMAQEWRKRDRSKD
jgi:hypothetical protein